MDEVQVLYVLNQASETSIPLEIAASLPKERVDVEVCSFYSPSADTFSVDVHSLEASSQVDPRAYVRLLQLARRFDPDVVHIHPNATGSVVRVLLAATDVTLVTTEHTSHERFDYFKQLLNGTTNALNDVVVANSQATLDSLTRWERIFFDITKTDTTVIHNGVNVSAINAAVEPPDLPMDSSAFLIGTVGRLSRVKNQETLLNAAAPLVNKFDDLALVFIGDGPLRSDLADLAADLDIKDSVYFLGHVNRQSVYKIMTAMDIFVFPSYHEGFGVAVAEAMASGVPVIASDIPALREVVGDTGLYFDPTDMATLRETMSLLYNDPAKRAKSGNAGKERVWSELSLESTVEEYTNLYELLVNH